MASKLQLTDVAKYVPQDNRNLNACVLCKIIMTESQWRRQNDNCPNCMKAPTLTPDFVGMISVMMPKESWVAKWNKVMTCIPGVYAINIPQAADGYLEDEGDMVRAAGDHDYGQEDQMDDFIVDDNTIR